MSIIVRCSRDGGKCMCSVCRHFTVHKKMPECDGPCCNEDGRVPVECVPVINRDQEEF